MIVTFPRPRFPFSIPSSFQGIIYGRSLDQVTGMDQGHQLRTCLNVEVCTFRDPLVLRIYPALYYYDSCILHTMFGNLKLVFAFLGDLCHRTYAVNCNYNRECRLDLLFLFFSLIGKLLEKTRVYQINHTGLSIISP